MKNSTKRKTLALDRNRILWAVASRTGKYGIEEFVISWQETGLCNRWDGEPCGYLLFETKEKAKKWCVEEAESVKDDSALQWMFRPVKVRETVSPVKPNLRKTS